MMSTQTLREKLFGPGGVDTPKATVTKPKPVAQAPKKSAVSKPKPTKGKAKMSRTSDKVKTVTRQERLESDHWHGKPATYSQTNPIYKSTGLQCWIDKKTGEGIQLTRKEASDLVSILKAAAPGQEDEAREIVETVLIDQYGAQPYVSKRKGAKNKGTATPKATPKPAPVPKPVEEAKVAETAVVASPAAAKLTPDPNDKKKKACSDCGETYWAFHLKDGLCSDCRGTKSSTPADKVQDAPDKDDEIAQLRRQIAGYKAAATRRANAEVA